MLAYADGDRLVGCLDLIHAPSERLWVEWSETTRQEALREIPNLDVHDVASAKRVGLLVSSNKLGRVGTIRTFWSMPNDVAYTGCLITEFDLDNPIRKSCDFTAIFEGQPAGIFFPKEPGVDAVLEHVRYRFDPAWGSYYRSARLPVPQQKAIWRAALGTTASDTAMILALFLLMAAKEGLQRRESELTKLNHARRRAGRTPFLEHVEVSLNMQSGSGSAEGAKGKLVRRPSRLHYVRGHLMRRGDKITWRSPHLRGSARQGSIRTRTISLSFH